MTEQNAPASQTPTAAKLWRTGNVIELPSGHSALIWRPSLVSMLSAGVFPNSLMGMARAVVEGDQIKPGEMEPEDIQRMTQVLDIVVAKCFVEPKCHWDIEEDAVPEGDIHVSWVADDDKNFLMAYIQNGVEALAAFRKGRESAAQARSDSEEVQPATKPVDGPTTAVSAGATSG